jgi:hypothetical protein
LIHLRKLLDAWELLEFDPNCGPQILANIGLRSKNLDFKELNSSVKLGSDDYCEAIMRVWICGAQGQMSQDLARGLWISVDCDWVSSGTPFFCWIVLGSREGVGFGNTSSLKERQA